MNRPGAAVLRSAAVLGILTVALPAPSMGPAAQAATVTFHGTGTSLTRVGSVSVRTLPSHYGSSPSRGSQAMLQRERRELRVHPDWQGRARPRTVSFPTGVTPTQVQNKPNTAGFQGITVEDQAAANCGALCGFEPPDQGLCTSASGGATGYLIDAVNIGFKIYRVTPSGPALAQNTVALNAFYGLAPAYNAATGAYGPFLSDPKCYYDVGTQRWFMTITEIDTDPATGNFGTHSAVYIAVSNTSDPTLSWTIYRLDTTEYPNVAIPGHPNCPCFGDQPLIGADAHGFYVSTNEYAISGPGYNGAQIYAMSKRMLEAGASTVPAEHYGALVADANGDYHYSVQPATSPDPTQWETDFGGTEYFLSAADFASQGDNRIFAWSLTGTSTLDATPFASGLVLTVHQIATEPYSYYANGPNYFMAAYQASGPTPFRNQFLCPAEGFSPNNCPEPLEMINANDDRMNQVVFSDDKLWSGLNTGVTLNSGYTKVSVAYFVVATSDAAAAPTFSLAGQGYVAPPMQDSAIYPSIGVNDKGQAIMAFTLTGPDYHPSAAYMPLSYNDLTGNLQTGPIEVAGVGQMPEDGFTGYYGEGGNGVARWGDYTAAVFAPEGYVYFATEYIPNSNTTPRALLSNWASWVGKVAPGWGAP